jgi:hypothetical protein
MPTSGIITSNMTAGEIMTLAMQELGVIGAGETPQGEEYEAMLPRLNFMLKSWQARGCNLWRETDGTITITANTASGTLSPRVIDVMAARVVNTPNQIPLQRWETGEYRQIPNKSQSGRPVAFYIDKQRDSVVMYVWPVPTTDTEINLDYARVIEDVTATTDNLDLPQAWIETAYMCLAARCAALFGATRIDPGTVGEVKQRAAMLETDMLDMDRPSSVMFGSSVSQQYF